MVFPRCEYWSGLPFPSPGHLSDPGIKPGTWNTARVFSCQAIILFPRHQVPNFSDWQEEPTESCSGWITHSAFRTHLSLTDEAILLIALHKPLQLLKHIISYDPDNNPSKVGKGTIIPILLSDNYTIQLCWEFCDINSHILCIFGQTGHHMELNIYQLGGTWDWSSFQQHLYSCFWHPLHPCGGQIS